LKETTLSEKNVYTCPIFAVTEGRVALPDGTLAFRNRVIHSGGSGVLPIDERGNVILVEQYRYGIGERSLEIPAGKLEIGEDPETCARRELIEEVGGVVSEMQSLGAIAATPAYDSEIIYIYMAKCSEFMPSQPDEGEFLRLCPMPLEKAVSLVMDGKITDAKTQIALLKANQLLK
ncbi:MAG: NUDIX hydrolase, partial [Clostridia bacterium]|nr:NUDIX hydrolase [Clostridia bacterium]